MKGRKPQTLNSASRRSSQHRLAVLGLFFFFFFFKGPLPDPALGTGFIKILIEFFLGIRWARGTHPVVHKSRPGARHLLSFLSPRGAEGTGRALPGPSARGRQRVASTGCGGDTGGKKHAGAAPSPAARAKPAASDRQREPRYRATGPGPGLGRPR